jgi:type II secretory ATPase GspE/PulE/Tfp pilus assembly ATPase PilB-like protein
MPDLLLAEAVAARATDVHLEPGQDGLRVRLRVDGALLPLRQLDGEEGRQLCSRIKVRAGMDIAQRMLPQDGSLRLAVGDQVWDIRVASQPTILGEKLVLRLLPGQPVEQELTALGMNPDLAGRFARLLHKGQGLVLVTGPTGCGKTTTLYTALNLLDILHLNIMTLEDPVEYRLPDIVQTQVNYRGGLDFATGLRGALRQDPDVMLVGEIRDSETAAITLRAALTGHLVLATLHTLDSRAAVARLLDMGCAPYQVAAALNGVLAQRLVRRPCTCQGGCRRCLNSGYYGRIGVFELLVMTPARRNAILTGRPLPPPSQTLLDDCRAKLEQGLTDAAQFQQLALSLEEEP